MLDEFGNEIPAPAGERVGFCQDCGKPLTQETVRTVGSGVFCEPCLEARVGASGQATSYGAPVAGPATAAGYTPPAGSHSASPVLAGFLGLIPGVGAMYNGQFAKGIVHLVIFAVLVMLSDNVSGVFGLFVFGWVCYQAFEAYHTAKARLEGLPLPNMFGFNDIGERMGFGKNWPGSVTRPSSTPPVTPWTPAPVPPVPPSNWAGYVQPDAFTSVQTVAPPVEPVTQASQPGSWGSSPYNAPPPPPYSAPYVPVATVAPAPAVVPVVPSRKFPIGAIWLIGLGLLFLLSINAHVRFSGLWLSAAIFAGLSAWMFAHRILQLHRVNPVGIPTGALLACVLRWPPVILMVLAVLFALQAANLYTLGQTWPVIFIALGAVVLMERTIGRTNIFASEEHPPVAAWAPENPKNDATNGGAQ